VIAWILRLGLAAVFAAAASHKLRRPSAFAATLREYQILPDAVTPAFVPLLALGEALIACGLLVPATAALAGRAAAAMLLLYSGAIALNLARGRRDIDCGCLGPTRREPLSGGLLVRNALLLVGALLLALPVAGRTLGWVDAPALGGGLAVTFLLFAAVNRLRSLAPRLARPGSSI